MEEVKFNFAIDLQHEERTAKSLSAMTLGELLYWVLFVEGPMESAEEQLQS
jgi:hypothetical protein